jgi:hypothetical protein
MAHGLADAQLALRAAAGGALLMMAGHCQNPDGRHRPRKRVIQYAVLKVISVTDGCAASAGHDLGLKFQRSRKVQTYRLRWIVSTR